MQVRILQIGKWSFLRIIRTKRGGQKEKALGNKFIFFDIKVIIMSRLYHPYLPSL